MRVLGPSGVEHPAWEPGWLEWWSWKQSSAPLGLWVLFPLSCVSSLGKEISKLCQKINLVLHRFIESSLLYREILRYWMENFHWICLLRWPLLIDVIWRTTLWWHWCNNIAPHDFIERKHFPLRDTCELL